MGVSVSDKISMFNKLSVDNTISTKKNDFLPVKKVRHCADRNDYIIAHRNDYIIAEKIEVKRSQQENGPSSPVRRVYRNDYNMAEISKLVKRSQQENGPSSPVSSVYRNDYNMAKVAKLSRVVTGWQDKSIPQSPSFSKLLD